MKRRTLGPDYSRHADHRGEPLGVHGRSSVPPSWYLLYVRIVRSAIMVPGIALGFEIFIVLNRRISSNSKEKS